MLRVVGSNPTDRESFRLEIFSISQGLQYLCAYHMINKCENDQWQKIFCLIIEEVLKRTFSICLSLDLTPERISGLIQITPMG